MGESGRTSSAAFEHGKICLRDAKTGSRLLLIPVALNSGKFELFLHGIFITRLVIIVKMI
jgi:hypothetical protein